MRILPNRAELPRDVLESRRAVVWKFETRDGKETKVPYMPTRPTKRAAVDDATTWGSFTEAWDRVAAGQADGAGIVLGDGVFGIDLDHCRDAATGVITAEALAVVAEIDSYTEISPSRTGLHVLGLGTLPPGLRKRNGLELYSELRYFTVTGLHVAGTPAVLCERTAALADLHLRIFGPPTSKSNSGSGQHLTDAVDLEDGALLELAHAAVNGAAFAALWAGDTSAHGDDDSAADLALCNHLAFWTGQDGVRMDRLFRQSGLMRDKWDSRRGDSTYGAITIAKAIAGCTTIYAGAGPSIELEEAAESNASPASHLPAEDPIVASAWPTLADDALIGVFGDVVRAVAPVTEADPVGVLVHVLVLFGNLIGRGPSVAVGEDQHYLNEHVLVIGDTSTGRKGMALNVAKALLGEVDPDWRTTRVLAGLSSGEGLIYAVRDPLESPDGEITDPGVADKRLAVLETEFAKTLRVSRRDANTLSTILRQCWDDGALRVLTRNSPLTATAAHVSVIGHITPLELRQELKTTDMASGLINRFLLVLVRRPHLLPDGGRLDAMVRVRLVAALRATAATARTVTALERDADALAHWAEIYGHLTRSRLGLVGAICNRAPAHVLRLAALYALGDQSATIRRRHQVAALALWDYAEASVTRIFGQRVGHRLANFLLETMRQAPEGLTRTEIRDVLGRHRQADEINEALQLLADLGLASATKEAPANAKGRPTMRWRAEESAT